MGEETNLDDEEGMKEDEDNETEEDEDHTHRDSSCLMSSSRCRLSVDSHAASNTGINREGYPKHACVGLKRDTAVRVALDVAETRAAINRMGKWQRQVPSSRQRHIK